MCCSQNNLGASRWPQVAGYVCRMVEAHFWDVRGVSVQSLSHLSEEEWDWFWVLYFKASQAALAVKNTPANAGDLGSISGSGRSPGKGHGEPTSVFLPGESHGQRSLAGYKSMRPQRVGHDWSDLACTRILWTQCGGEGERIPCRGLALYGLMMFLSSFEMPAFLTDLPRNSLTHTASGLQKGARCYTPSAQLSHWFRRPASWTGRLFFSRQSSLL